MSMTSGRGDIPFYEDERSYKLAGAVGIGGAVLLILSTIFSWKSLYVKTAEVSRSGISIIKSVINAFQGMFIRDLEDHIVDRNISIHGILPWVFLIIFYLVVLLMGYLAFVDNIQKRELLTKHKKLIRLGLVVSLIILLIILTHTASFRNSSRQYQEAVSTWSSYIENSVANHVAGAERMRSRLSAGLGVWCFVLGEIAYIVSIAFNFILETLNEDEEVVESVESAESSAEE